jgi:SAM-dependent methyltransferase
VRAFLGVKTSLGVRASLGTSADAASGQGQVDALNADFYGKIQYPWPPAYYERFSRSDFWAKMMGQDIGSWDAPIVPSGGSVWVPGCGRNQAVITALRFPDARIVGSDLSEPSLEASRSAARELGIRNLELRCESLNCVDYAEEFDYVLCTGVIHHNADPRIALQRLVKSMRPAGVLELMVYNEYHRYLTAAFQKALRTILGNPQTPQYERELALAQGLVALASSTKPEDWGIVDGSGRGLSAMLAFLSCFEEAPPGQFADSLIQPVEQSYDIRGLAMLVGSCGAELLHFCVDQFSRASGKITWNLHFPDAQIQSVYDALDDISRWQVTNLLTMDDSPMLWFYAQRADSPRARQSEHDLCVEFQRRKFKPVHTTCEMVSAAPGGGSPTTQQLHFPRGRPASDQARRVFEYVSEGAPLKAALADSGIGSDFRLLHLLRVQLATSAFPFIESA